jgi:hypothetical protein
LLERAPFHRGSEALATYYTEATADPAGSPPAQRLCACLSLRDARLDGQKLTLRLRAHGRCPNDLALRFGPDASPARVELPFDGVLSPRHLAEGDGLRSVHLLGDKELANIRKRGLWVGALRSQGDPPSATDPRAVRVQVLIGE